jgi:hypothetical protein
MWLTGYAIGNETFTIHYLSGTAPFKLGDYQVGIKLIIKRDEKPQLGK